MDERKPPGSSHDAPDRTDIARALRVAAGGLTQREVEILGLIARGLTNGEIAERLFLSSHTIKTHINRIFVKTGSRDRVAAIGYAQRHNIGWASLITHSSAKVFRVLVLVLPASR